MAEAGAELVGFNSRTPGGVRLGNVGKAIKLLFVSIHAPREGCDELAKVLKPLTFVSIHAPREGCDPCSAFAQRCVRRFNSRTPGGVRHLAEEIAKDEAKFQFTHPGRGATCVEIDLPALDEVSIHAPREGCDSAGYSPADYMAEFQFTHPGRGATARKHVCEVGWVVSIHAPREGCDQHALHCTARNTKVSIHAPREGCDVVKVWAFVQTIAVSIHAPREGCDTLQSSLISPLMTFQFTHPGRGATRGMGAPGRGACGFNSRTPGGVRQQWQIWAIVTLSFNSRTPGGVRLLITYALSIWLWFQFTHPGRGATLQPRHHTLTSQVSIHAPREGCDLSSKLPYATRDRFQFTHPGRGATRASSLRGCLLPCFNSRTPGGVRPSLSVKSLALPSFNSRTPGGVRRLPVARIQLLEWFQFTHPGRGATVCCKVAYYRADKQA